MFGKLKEKLDLGNRIETRYYGLVTISTDENLRFGNTYFVTAIKDKIHLAGLIDENGKEIIPLEEMTLSEFFYTEHKKDICFGFQVSDISPLKYYHLQKQKDSTYQLKIATNPLDQEPISIRQVREEKSLWVFDKQMEDGEHEYAIYRPSEVRMITGFFDELNFDIEKNPYGHFAYVCNYIIAEIESEINEGEIEKVPLTTVCAFIDFDGNFSSQLLDVKDSQLYNCYLVDGTSTSKNYGIFLSNLQQKHLNQYLEDERLTDNTLNYLFNNCNQSIQSSILRKPAKILEFKPKNS